MPNQMLWILLLLLVAVVIIRLVLRHRRSGAAQAPEATPLPTPIESARTIATDVIGKSVDKGREVAEEVGTALHDGANAAAEAGASLAGKTLEEAEEDAQLHAPAPVPVAAPAAKEPEPRPAIAAVKAPEPAPAPAPASPKPSAAPTLNAIGIAGAVGEPDNLLLIKGLGPKLSALLGTLGITRFDQIAAWNEGDIAKVDAHLGTFKGRITRDGWIEQATLLANGEIEAFEARFGKVDAAKR